MAKAILYEGAMSAGLILTALGDRSAAHIIAIPCSNGQEVKIFGTG